MSINLIEVLARKPYIEDAGAIPNPKEFSAPCRQLFSRHAVIDEAIMISERGSGFNLEKLPAQFRPSARIGMKAFKQKHGTLDVNCHAVIHQGVATPENPLSKFGIHIDHRIKGFPMYYGTAIESQFISDYCPTVLYNQEFIIPTHLPLIGGFANHALNEEFERQADPSARVIGEPYHLMRTSPFIAHVEQRVPKPKHRTFMAMIYC